MTSIVSFLLILLVLAGGLIYQRTQAFRQQEFMIQSSDFVAQLQRERLPLTTTQPTDQVLNLAQNRVSELLQTYDAESVKDWRSTRRLLFLTPQQQEQEAHAISAVHLQFAEALIRRAKYVLDDDQKQKLLHRAEAESAVAMELYPALAHSRSILAQKSVIARLRSQTELAERFWQRALETPVGSELDRMVAAYGFYSTGEFERAFSLIQASIQADPQNIEAWLLLGNLHTASGQYAEAAAAYSICIGLDPELEIAFFNRALARRDSGNFAGAVADFNQTIKINNSDWSNFANRGLLHFEGGNFPEAINDFDNAIQLGSSETRLYYLRAQAHRNLGNTTQAEADYSTFLKLEPTDETSCIERGICLLQEGRTQEAASDFARAIQLNPRSIESWQNTAHLHSEIKHDIQPAIEAMSRVVEILPDDATSVATRGVLYARSGNRTAALQDAEKALSLSHSGETLYRVAGIFAQTSRLNNEDKRTALGLLSGAVLHDPQTVIGYLNRDTDLDPLREEPEFTQIQSFVRQLQEWEQWQTLQK